MPERSGAQHESVIAEMEPVEDYTEYCQSDLLNGYGSKLVRRLEALAQNMA